MKQLRFTKEDGKESTSTVNLELSGVFNGLCIEEFHPLVSKSSSSGRLQITAHLSKEIDAYRFPKLSGLIVEKFSVDGEDYLATHTAKSTLLDISSEECHIPHILSCLLKEDHLSNFITYEESLRRCLRNHQIKSLKGQDTLDGFDPPSIRYEIPIAIPPVPSEISHPRSSIDLVSSHKICHNKGCIFSKGAIPLGLTKFCRLLLLCRPNLAFDAYKNEQFEEKVFFLTKSEEQSDSFQRKSSSTEATTRPTDPEMSSNAQLHVDDGFPSVSGHPIKPHHLLKSTAVRKVSHLPPPPTLPSLTVSRAPSARVARLALTRAQTSTTSTANSSSINTSDDLDAPKRRRLQRIPSNDLDEDSNCERENLRALEGSLSIISSSAAAMRTRRFMQSPIRMNRLWGGRTWASKLDENLSNEVCDNRNFVNSEDMAVNVVRDGLISEILSMFATFKSQNFILRESTESQRVAEMFLATPHEWGGWIDKFDALLPSNMFANTQRVDWCTETWWDSITSSYSLESELRIPYEPTGAIESAIKTIENAINNNKVTKEDGQNI